jgi:hypothetical protein
VLTATLFRGTPLARLAIFVLVAFAHWLLCQQACRNRRKIVHQDDNLGAMTT